MKWQVECSGESERMERSNNHGKYDYEFEQGSRIHNIQLEINRDNVAVEQVIFDIDCGKRRDTMKQRPLNKNYNISYNRYKELQYFTLQYPEWKRTGEWDKYKLVEEIVLEAAGEVLFEYILEAVTTGSTYDKINIRKRIPCGKNMFYEMRRRYFFLLNKAKDFR